ncbi:glycine-rich domain-containing protein [Mesorhizobium marinum]|uniref:glycine-rich domain-containing protein n=1 Tax=Mesorhizobium marinum TaxID=3228790 RepID=UPI003467BE81
MAQATDESSKDGAGGAPSPLAALGFEAPYLVERLVKHQLAASVDEADALFDEVKKYLVLAATDKSRVWDMYSLRVDEVWHQFILYTAQYSRFCQSYFGHYVHHAPNNAPRSGAGSAVPVASFAEFCDRYRQLFGQSLPDVWYDERSLAPDRRLRNALAGKLTIRRQGETLDLVADTGDILLTINDIAGDALAFIARSPAFYVRELPGGLDDEEKVGLAAALVESGVLRVAG